MEKVGGSSYVVANVLSRSDHVFLGLSLRIYISTNGVHFWEFFESIL